MIDVGIEALLVMDKAGIPILFQQLDPKHSELDPILLSGFLTALKTFSSTIIDDTAMDFHVDYGKRLITIINGVKIVFAAIHNSKFTDRIVPILTPLLQEFESKYYLETHVGEPGPLEEYESFRERLLSVMGISHFSLDWIPFIIKEQELKNQPTTFLSLWIKNNRSISQIITESANGKSEVLKELSRLWVTGQIKFRNMLTKQDILIYSNQIADYLQPSKTEWINLSKEFPNLIAQLPFVISHLDGRTTVEQIIHDLGFEGLENIFWLLDYLFVNDAIRILSPEKRRILMAKEILQKSLEIAIEIYPSKEVLQSLKNTLTEIQNPEIISQIKIIEKSWTIDYSFIVYEGLTPEKVIKSYEIWLEVLRLFIFDLKENKRKKFIEVLSDELDYDFFAKYRSEDMDGFEEFAYWLEIIFN